MNQLDSDFTSATYLLTWNPGKWYWEEIQECIAELEEYGYFENRWSCGTTKRIRPDDRLFIIRLGEEPRGIFASGRAASCVYEDDHWDESNPNEALYVEMDLDTLLDPDTEEILSLEVLEAISTSQTWTPQNSGISIENTVAAELESEWIRFLNSVGKVTRPERVTRLPEEVRDSALLYEGATRQVTVNAYERNPDARNLCIRHYGTSCCVCGFNFSQTYGDLGAGFIHVHHLKPLSEVGDEHKVDPVKDLRPVCPNCHAMIHRRRPAYTIEEMKMMLKAVWK